MYLLIFKCTGDGRSDPLFPVAVWSQYWRVINREDRTNNYVEAAHKKLHRELGVDHPNLWRFIDALRSVQSERDTYLEQLVAGRAPRVKARRYLAADERIARLVEACDDSDPDGYLRGIAHNFMFL